MSEDRAGPEGTIGREERDETPSVCWLGPAGLYVLTGRTITLWSATDFIPGFELDITTLETPAKPVGSVSSPPDSSS